MKGKREGIEGRTEKERGRRWRREEEEKELRWDE